MKKPLNILIIIMAIAVVGGFIYYSQRKPVAQTPVLSLQTYTDPSGDFSFNYVGTPGQLVSTDANDSAGYPLRSISINSSSTTSTSIITYTDKSYTNWETAVENDSVEHFGLRWPLSVSTLLSIKNVGYNCLKDFGYNSTSNFTCEIVNINGTKAFKTIMGVSNQGDTAQYKYVFYKNGTWYEFVKTFNNKDSGTDQLLWLRGEISNKEIQKEVKDFNDLISTVKFN